MPGLNQLKQLSTDVLALGDELKLRKLRGEKPSVAVIPSDISPESDADDFIAGMPREDGSAPEPSDAGSEGEVSSRADNDLFSMDDDEDIDVSGMSLDDLFGGIPGIDDVDAGMDGAGGSGTADDGGADSDAGMGDIGDIGDAGGSIPDAGIPDSGLPDAGIPDAGLPDAGVPDSGLPDAGIPDSGLPDAGLPDAGIADSGIADSGIADSSIPDAGIPDAGTAAGGDEFDISGLGDIPGLDLGGLGFPDDGMSSGDAAAPGSDAPAADDIPGTADEFVPPDTGAETNAMADGADGSPAGEDFVPPDAGSAAIPPEPPAGGSDELYTMPGDEDFGGSGQEIDMGGQLPDDGGDFAPPEGAVLGPDDDVAASVAASDFDLDPSVAVGGDESLDDTFSMDDPFADPTGAGAPAGTDGEAGAPGDADAGAGDGALQDFEFPETDSTLASGDDGFELDGQNDFEIPGWSDTAGEASFEKRPEPRAAASSKAKGEDQPRTSLTDEEYAQFKKNLADYPLNVRIAVEDLIVKNEFTDDAVFEVIDKVLKKVSARQLAAHLEKMLDITINVPRDYERRSFAEYQAYKSSLQYQLRNRIIPAALAILVAGMIGICVYYAVREFIYKPVRASGLYKQGYEQLEASDYPSSETLFAQALSYHPSKSWFFKYAHGYQEHKQYNRAEEMYKRLLSYFNLDKKAGLEYAVMEMQDLANYERAETIVRRYVLDHYINDKSGMLLLGDIYLEWATEKDPAKFDDARQQYASLIQMFGSSDLYLSRMLRYFIRTDNLREVLQLKEYFFPKKKALDGDSLIELSGYLLDKEYGELAVSDEYLRSVIEDVRPLLERAVKASPGNPIAMYNMARYFVKTDNNTPAISYLQETIDLFNKVKVSKKDVYKRIDTYRMLGEMYTDNREYVKAEETFSNGISIFQDEHDNNGLVGNADVGKLYSGMGDIAYFISGNADDALRNYSNAILNENDTASLRYRVGVIQYSRNEYSSALGSFIKAAENVHDDNHLLIALGNVLALRGDNYAAEGYYKRLLDSVAVTRNRYGILLPHERYDEFDIVDVYMKAANNLGVTQYKIAQQTGNSSMNANAIVNLTDSMQAWDVLTRNPDTMLRLGGSNLAEQNIKYITHPIPAYEPTIYGDIPRTLTGEKGLQP